MTPPNIPAPAPTAPHTTSTASASATPSPVAPVCKTVTVRATPEHAFRVFTDGIDRWWPRDHHIGTSPMRRVVIEPSTGGRCYTLQEDGTDCDWGTVLQWESPHRVVIAWRITSDWKFETDLQKSSEVEVRFIPVAEGATRVELEHRYLERHGAGANGMRSAVDSPNGWSGTLQRFVTEAER